MQPVKVHASGGKMYTWPLRNLQVKDILKDLGVNSRRDIQMDLRTIE